MGSEMMDLDQLAVYLQRDAREINKMASRGHLPGQKVSGRWRFAKAEINHWLETQLPDYDEKQLTALESHGGGYSAEEPVVSAFLSETSIAVPLAAHSRSSVLKELVRLAEQSWNVYDPEAILAAVQQREELGSTALPTGVAIPHPHRPLKAALGDSVIAYGRSASGIPFGDPPGLTDIFFLVCPQDDRSHLRILARLSRLLLRPGFLDELRAAETPAETFQLIQAAEQELLASS